MTRSRILAIAGIVTIAAISAIALFAGGTTARKWIFSQAIPPAYFSHFDTIAPALYQVSGPVYAFEKGFTRSLVLRTPEGVAIFDTFNEEHAAAMKDAITRQFPGEAIRWTILSHNHLDHIRGSALLGAQEVIGHKDVNTLVADWPDTGKGIATVTRTIEGDQTLTLGGIEVQALYMPYSHSHTLYGFFVPSAGVVYAPDMMFVKTLPPYDFPDFYYPGYIRALDRLIALNAAHYVPSHTWRGTRADMVDYRNMAVDFQTTVKEELLARGIESATDGPAVQEALRAAYNRLEPKYGKWHGFNEMFVPKYGRHVGGTYLGY